MTKQGMRILVVEDVAASRAWMMERLRAAYGDAGPLVVDEAASLARARQLLAGRPALDLVLLDLGLPDGRGSDLIPELLQGHGDVQVIITTIYDDDDHLFSALRAGARGYLLKDQPAPAFEAALKALRDGVPALSPSVARRLIGHFSAPMADCESADCLTARERDVLVLIARGLSVAEAADSLRISAHTVRGYVKDIYRKLGISSRAEASIKAGRLGLIRLE